MNIDRFLDLCCDEDLGRGDLFERVIEENFSITALIVAKQSGVLSGIFYVHRLCQRYGVEILFNKKDCESFSCGDILLEIRGMYSVVLKLERVILNLLQHSSGIASLTHAYVKRLQDENLQTILLDTRKSRPLLRIFEKYSVRNGGGRNHRLGLDDALMLKDTHLRYIPLNELKSFLKKARVRIPWTSKIEVESEDVDFARVAMDSGADIVMCDNMPAEWIKEVVSYRDTYHPHVLLEASGNITEDTLIEVARTGVDAISSGSIIHQAMWLDMHMRIC